MQPFALANIHQRFLQVLQIVFGKVVLVSSLAVDWPFGVGLRLYIEFAQAVDYDVGMDVACSVIAICMGADQSLMSDVENRINMILETIRKAAMTGFTKMTGVLLKQYLDNKVVNDGKQSIDEEKLNIALERIGEEIETSDKIKIRKLVSDGTIYKDSNEHLLNLIVNLIESYEKQSFYDEKVKKFKDVCNGYLDGKKYVYDESNLTLEIYRDNYRKPINLKNLSSGEKQVLSIFSKLYLDDEKPCIILFDEPELSLSIKWQEHFLPDIMESQKCKMLIAVTHSPFIFENQYDNLAQDMGRCITEVKGE